MLRFHWRMWSFYSEDVFQASHMNVHIIVEVVAYSIMNIIINHFWMPVLVLWETRLSTKSSKSLEVVVHRDIAASREVDIGHVLLCNQDSRPASTLIRILVTEEVSSRVRSTSTSLGSSLGGWSTLTFLAGVLRMEDKTPCCFTGTLICSHTI